MPSRLAARALARRLSLVLAVLLPAATLPGLLAEEVYRDNLLVASGWRGTDLVTLTVALPLLLTALARARRGSARAELVWLGALLYTAYDYAFYLFAAAFNELFLIYAALFTVGLLALALGLTALDTGVLAIESGAARRGVAAWLTLLALALGGVHVSAALRHVLTGTLPTVVTATGHPTNVVAALDLALVVMPSLLAARWLWTGDRWGVALGVLLNVKGAVYMPALAAATLAAARAGAPVDAGQAVVWSGIGVGCLVALLVLLRGIGTAPAPPRRGAATDPGVH